MTPLKLPSNNKSKYSYLLLLNAVYEKGLAVKKANHTYVPINIFSREQIINIMAAESVDTRSEIIRQFQLLESDGYIKNNGEMTTEGENFVLEIRNNFGFPLELNDIKSFISIK